MTDPWNWIAAGLSRRAARHGAHCEQGWAMNLRDPWILLALLAGVAVGVFAWWLT